MLPARLALCDLEAPNWGSLGFRIVLLLLPGSFFLWPELVAFRRGLRYLRLTRLPRHDCGPVPGGNRSAATWDGHYTTTRRDHLSLSCCFLAHRLLYGIFVVCYSLLFYFAVSIPRVIQCYHLFWYFSNNYELTSWSPGRAVFILCPVLFLFFLCVWGFVLLLLCCFCGCLVLVGCPCTVTAQWIMHRSSFSSTFGVLCRYDDFAIALIHWICKYATGFPACLTTWREPYGVGRKKKGLISLHKDSSLAILLLLFTVAQLFTPFCSGHRLANSFCGYFGDTVGLSLSCRRQSWRSWCGLFWCGSGRFFVLVRCFLCWRNANLAGRFACRRCVVWALFVLFSPRICLVLWSLSVLYFLDSI